MRMPRKDTYVFTLLTCLVKNGAMTPDQIYEELGNFNRGKKGINRLLVDCISYNYIVKSGETYEVIDEVAAYVEDVNETMGAVRKKDVVMPAYRNAFTPEMKNYHQQLFVNKRGYQ